MRLALVGFAVLGSLSARAQTLPTPTAPDEIPFLPIEVGMDSKIKKDQILVIRNADDLHSYLVKIDELDLKKPKVIWKSQQLMAIHIAGFSGGPVSFRVKRLHKMPKGDVEIEVVLNKSSQSAGTSPANPNLATKKSYPFAIIQTPRFDAKTEVSVVTD